MDVGTASGVGVGEGELPRGTVGDEYADVLTVGA